MKKSFMDIFTITICAAFLSCPVLALATPILDSASSFAVLGGAAVTNTGATTITGDIGVHPGSSLTNDETTILTGAYHQTDAVAAQAQIDATAAYNSLAAMTSTSNLTARILEDSFSPRVSTILIRRLS